MTQLTRDFRTGMIARLRREPEFAIAMVGEAVELMIEGNAVEARSILRTVTNAVGFEELAAATGTHAKTLHKQLSASGNPTMNAMVQIIQCLASEIMQKPMRATVRFEAVA